MSPNYSAATAPCPYVVDGVMVTTVATPGQNSLWMVTTPSPPDTFGVVEIQHRGTGATARYTIPRAAQEFLDEWTEPLDAQSRFEAVMAMLTSRLFVVAHLNSSESDTLKGHRTSAGKLIAFFE